MEVRFRINKQACSQVFSTEGRGHEEPKQFLAVDQYIGSSWEVYDSSFTNDEFHQVCSAQLCTESVSDYSRLQPWDIIAQNIIRVINTISESKIPTVTKCIT
jgi:hypothetical protein